MDINAFGSTLPTPEDEVSVPSSVASSSKRPSTSAAGQPLKRGTACLSCRQRKIRCSGGRPAACELCVKDGRECVYEEPKVKAVPPSGKNKISALENKIAELEKVLTRQLAPAQLGPSPAFGQQTQAQPSFPSFPVDTSYLPSLLSNFQLSNNPSPQLYDPAPFSIAPQPPQPPMAFTGFPPQPPSTAPPSSALVSRTTNVAAASAPYPQRAPRSRVLTEDARREIEQRLFMAEIERLFGTAQGEGFQQSPPLISPEAQGGWGSMRAPAGSLNAEQSWQEKGLSQPFDAVGSFDGSAGAMPPVANSTTDFGAYLNLSHLSSPVPSQPSHDSAAAPSAASVFYFPDFTSSDAQPTADEPRLFDVVLQDWADAGKVGDLPAVVRNELVEISMRWRRQVALILNPYELVASLDAQEEERRPHPGFIWALCTHGSRYHPSLLVRTLQEHFYRTARIKLDEGLGRQDRVLDVIRGTALLSSCLLMNGRFHEGFNVSGSASRLAMSAMLHRISWPPFREDDGAPQARYLALPKQPPQLLPPPVDLPEVMSRIYAFWQVVTMDRVASISTRLPPCIPDDEIETPFCPSMRILEQSFCPTVQVGKQPFSCSEKAMEQPMNQVPVYKPTCVADLFSEEVDPVELARSNEVYELHVGGFVFRVLILLSRATRLSDHFVQPSSRAAYLAQAPVAASQSSSSTPQGSSPEEMHATSSPPLTADVRPCPPETLELERALDRFVISLPARFRDPSRLTRAEDENGFESEATTDIVRPLLFLLLSEIQMAYALVHEEQARSDHERYWPKCVSAARQVVQLIRTIADVDWGQLDIFMGICWNEICRILVTEVRSRRAKGHEQTARAVETELEIIALSMKRLSTVFDVHPRAAERPS